MKKTVTASLCMALMISSVSAGAKEFDMNLLDKYISDKKICITADKCFDFENSLCKDSIFKCILGSIKFPTTDNDKPSVEVKPETDKPSVEVKPDANKPSVEVKPETDKPSVEVKPETDKPSVDTNESSLAQQVLRLVNEYRAQNGKKALVLDEKLNSVALAHSIDMKNNNYFSHTNLKGQSPFDRLKNAGISYTTAGENIAMGQKTAESVVSSWINSEGHRKNILNDSFGKMGLGAVEKGSGYYWTQIFTN